MKKSYYYVMPEWQNEPLCIVCASEKGLKKAKREFPKCTFEPCPYVESDYHLDLHNYD
jgi:hypothetical protein